MRELLAQLHKDPAKVRDMGYRIGQAGGIWQNSTFTVKAIRYSPGEAGPHDAMYEFVKQCHAHALSPDNVAIPIACIDSAYYGIIFMYTAPGDILGDLADRKKYPHSERWYKAIHERLHDCVTRWHASGLAHGDLHDMNIIVHEADGAVNFRVIDFGISVLLKLGAEAESKEMEAMFEANSVYDKGRVKCMMDQATGREAVAPERPPTFVGQKQTVMPDHPSFTTHITRGAHTTVEGKTGSSNTWVDLYRYALPGRGPSGAYETAVKFGRVYGSEGRAGAYAWRLKGPRR